MKAVSFSVYGTKGVYAEGLLENLRRLPEVYPCWQALVHTDGAAGENWLARCRDLGARVVLRERRDDAGGMFWRFEPVGDPAWEAVVVRDADSVVTGRETAAVEEWLRHPAGLHVMHDADYHWNGPWPVLGGMWGAKCGALPYDFPHLVRWWLKQKGPFSYNGDQWFLRRYVWPHVLRHGLIHTGNANSRYRGRPFPPHPPAGWHTGESLTPEMWSGREPAGSRRRHQERARPPMPTPPKPSPPPPLPHGFAA